MRALIEPGDQVRIKEKHLYTYRQIYAVTREDVMTVVHIEKRSGRRCLYLRRPGWEVWMPVWRPHVVKVRTKT